MEGWFGFLMITGAVAGLAIGALSHPKFYAAVFKKKPESADHEHSID